MDDVPRVYLDSCCFIDMVKTKVGRAMADEREGDVWTLKRLLEANRDSEVHCFTSTLSIAECSHDGSGKVTDTVKSEFTRLLMSGQYVKLIQMTPFIAQDARDLRWNHGINVKGADGVHVASAVAMQCVEFISSNGNLNRLMKSRPSFTKLGLTIRRGQRFRLSPGEISPTGVRQWQNALSQTSKTALKPSRRVLTVMKTKIASTLR